MSFDPNTFLDSVVTEANATKIIPCPVGEYTAVVKDVKPRMWTSKNDPSKSGVALDIIWDVDDLSVKEVLGRDSVTVKQGLMLDMNSHGQLETGEGKNVGLGRLREAVGLNQPGRPFSPNMLAGQAARIKVKHRVDGEDVYAEVERVAKL